MPSYILRNIDPTLWQRVKTRATGEQLPLRQLLLLLLRGYADGELHIRARGDESASSGRAHGPPSERRSGRPVTASGAYAT